MFQFLCQPFFSLSLLLDGNNTPFSDETTKQDVDDNNNNSWHICFSLHSLAGQGME